MTEYIDILKTCDESIQIYLSEGEWRYPPFAIETIQTWWFHWNRHENGQSIEACYFPTQAKQNTLSSDSEIYSLPQAKWLAPIYIFNP